LAYDTRTAKKTIESIESQRQKLGWKDGIPPSKYDKPIKFDPKYVSNISHL